MILTEPLKTELKSLLREINFEIEHCYDHFEFHQLKAKKEAVELLLNIKK